MCTENKSRAKHCSRLYILYTVKPANRGYLKEGHLYIEDNLARSQSCQAVKQSLRREDTCLKTTIWLSTQGVWLCQTIPLQRRHLSREDNLARSPRLPLFAGVTVHSKWTKYVCPCSSVVKSTILQIERSQVWISGQKQVVYKGRPVISPLRDF
jgi:hypothetical protein